MSGNELRSAALLVEYLQFRIIETMIANGANVFDILDYCREKRTEIEAQIHGLE